MGNRCGLFKGRHDSYVTSEDLPNELLTEILSYLGKKERLNVSLVNLRWFQVINSQIKELTITRPTTTENLQEIENLINRFPIRSLSLTNRINNLSELALLKSLAFKAFSLEFDVNANLIQSKHIGTWIKRVKLEKFEDFEDFQHNHSQVIHLEVSRPISFEVEEEILSLDKIERISLDLACLHTNTGRSMDRVISRRFIEVILTRPHLKQIDFRF